jgi:hypothetical protein
MMRSKFLTLRIEKTGVSVGRSHEEQELLRDELLSEETSRGLRGWFFPTRRCEGGFGEAWHFCES